MVIYHLPFIDCMNEPSSDFVLPLWMGLPSLTGEPATHLLLEPPQSLQELACLAAELTKACVDITI